MSDVIQAPLARLPTGADSIEHPRGSRENVARTARAVTRPIISIMFAGVIAGAVLEGIELPERFWVIAGVVILEWWGERAVTRIRGKE